MGEPGNNNEARLQAFEHECNYVVYRGTRTIDSMAWDIFGCNFGAGCRKTTLVLRGPLYCVDSFD